LILPLLHFPLTPELPEDPKLILVVLTSQLKAVTGWPVKQFGQVLRIFQPETVFKWHRELVRRKVDLSATGAAWSAPYQQSN
ncbi:MAG: hypothetical protein ABI947_28220, partial [Chloroflexota bacterium]